MRSNLIDKVEKRVFATKTKALNLLEYHKLKPRDLHDYGMGFSTAANIKGALKNRPESVTLQNCWLIEEICKERDQEKKVARKK
jgi:hypothetical protein